MRILCNLRGMAASVSLFLISSLALASNGAATLPPNASPDAAAALTQAQLNEIDDYLADYYNGVVITRRTVNDQGEDISCVDVLHQPGSRHSPQIQLEPSEQLKALLGWHVTQAPPSLICPQGSVEMRLPSREQIIARGGLQKFLRRDSAPGSRPVRPTVAAPTTTASSQSAPAVLNGHYWSTVYQETDLVGAQSTFTLWKPAVPKVADPIAYTLFSLSQMWLDAGDYQTSTLQTVEAGTHVYQRIYGDVEVHFFIYWTADAYLKTGCQDLNCPGFVVTSNVLPIGGKLQYSSTGSASLEGTVAWYRDPSTGNWILFLYDALNGYRQVGYYPGAIYNGGPLARNARRVLFGGEVFTPPADAPTLPMGSGYSPATYGGTLYKYVAYQRNLKLMDLTGSILDLTSSRTVVTPTNDGCAYGARVYLASAPYAPGWGTSVFYGGRGFSTVCPRS